MFNYKLCKCIYQKDMYSLYLMMTGYDQYLFSTKIICKTEKAFNEWLMRQMSTEFHDFYMVKDTVSQKDIGFVYNYDFSLQDGHCKICVYIISEYRDTGIGGFVGINFMKLLFSQYPLRKIYLTIYDYNTQSLQSNVNAGFIEEGCIKEYRYYNGRYYNLHYLSMTKEHFMKTLGKL